jgi:hypothetical protein
VCVQACVCVPVFVCVNIRLVNRGMFPDGPGWVVVDQLVNRTLAAAASGLIAPVQHLARARHYVFRGYKVGVPLRCLDASFVQCRVPHLCDLVPAILRR